MKQLLILSGKGGTGKTTVASAFIRFSETKAAANSDTDAPNRRQVIAQLVQPKQKEYYGLSKAQIDHNLCLKCGQCISHCRFNAIIPYQVDPFACEGCGVCQSVCPAGAVSLIHDGAGEFTSFETGKFNLLTARNKTGGGDSGCPGKEDDKLRTEEADRGEAADIVELAIIDGSPGIGCPAIAFIGDVDMVLIVTEPSVSDIFDMKRIIKTAQTFHTMTAVCVNKYDTNLGNSYKIEVLCTEMGIPFVGRIPFDPEAVRAVNNGRTIADVECPSGRATKAIYGKVLRLLQIY